MSDGDDYIGSWNGHRGTPQDKLAIGCAWFVGFVALAIVLVAGAQFAEQWWKS